MDDAAMVGAQADEELDAHVEEALRLVSAPPHEPTSDPDAPLGDDVVSPTDASGPPAGAHDTRGLRRRTMRGMWLMGSSAGIQAVLQIVFVGVLAHLIAPKQYGLVTGALVAVSLSTILAESGIGAAVVQRKTLEPIHIRVGWTLSIMIGIFFWAVLALAAPAVQALMHLHGLVPILRVVALIFVINSLTLGNYLLARRLQFGRLAIAECSAYAFGYGLVASVLAWRGYGPWAIVGGQLGQAVVLNGLSYAFAPHSILPAFRRQPAKELLSYGGGHTIARIGQWASVNADDIVVSRFLGAANLGLYGRSYQLVNMPANLFGQVANDVLFPAMAAVQDQKERLRRVLRLAVGFLAGVSLPITAVAAVTSKELVLVLLGRDWLPLRDAFDVIVFGMLFRTSVKLSDSVARATGAVYRRAWRTWLFACLVAIGALSGAHWGLHGVAFGVLAALLINYLVMSQLGLNITGMPWREFFVAHLPGFTLAIVAGGVAYAAQYGLQAVHVKRFEQLILVWLIAFLGTVLAIRVAPRIPGLKNVARFLVDFRELFRGRQQQILSRLLGSLYPPPRQRVRDPNEKVASRS
ncbi:MAG: lipopolysaccharide biosynthesis protein [Actinomycetes bacterium]